MRCRANHLIRWPTITCPSGTKSLDLVICITLSSDCPDHTRIAHTALFATPIISAPGTIVGWPGTQFKDSNKTSNITDIRFNAESPAIDIPCYFGSKLNLGCLWQPLNWTMEFHHNINFPKGVGPSIEIPHWKSAIFDVVLNFLKSLFFRVGKPAHSRLQGEEKGCYWSLPVINQAAT